MKFYIAFSIHGSNCFITASYEVNEQEQIVFNKKSLIESDPSVVTIHGMEFVITPSRRPSYNPDIDGYKLHHSELMTKAGQPLKCPARILNFFIKLESLGWKVEKKSFINRHYWDKFKKKSQE